MAQQISTGPEVAKSTTRSLYFSGISKDSATLISRVKILGVVNNPDGSLSARAIAVDSDGNFIPLQQVASRLRASVTCRSQSPMGCTIELEGASNEPKIAGSSAYVAIDNSVMSGVLLRDALLGLKSSMSGASSADSLGIGAYNQTLTTIQRVGPLQRTIENVRLDDLAPASGVSALYTSILSAARELDQSAGNKVLVFVTSSGDNASAVYNTHEIVQNLNQAGITLHVIRVGYDMVSHPLRYMASSTGGSFYTIEPEEALSTGQIIREILYGQRWHTDIRIKTAAAVKDFCSIPWLHVQVAEDGLQSAISDSIRLAPEDQYTVTSPAVVALFGDDTDLGLQSYYPLLTSLAERLTADINLTIELVGHVGTEGGPDSDGRALERANNVKDFLLVQGVLDKQVVVRSEGNSKPLFYFQDDGARRMMNNRVEATLIKSVQRPATIIVDQVGTEDLAEKQQNVWVSRKYRAFYEPVYDNGTVAYRVVLYGFPSKSLAEVAASEIRKKFKLRFAVVQ